MDGYDDLSVIGLSTLIAERLFGWKLIEIRTSAKTGKQTPLGYPPDVNWHSGKRKIPLFAGDLNECAKAEKSLTRSEQKNYIDELYHVIFEEKGHVIGRMGILQVTATAAQRCIAILRSLGGKDESN